MRAKQTAFFEMFAALLFMGQLASAADVEVLLDDAQGNTAFVVRDGANVERMRVSSAGELRLNEGAQGGIAIRSAGGPIAIGAQSSADGVNRVALGNEVQNEVDESTAVRGNLYLDGGTTVFYRAEFGSGAWQNIREGLLTEEADPLFNASPAAGITSQDLQRWNAAFEWGDHREAGYAAAADLVSEEQARIAADRVISQQVSAVVGDLAAEMSARIAADAALSNRVAAKLDSNVWANANSTTNFVARTGDTMSGPLRINADGGSVLAIESDATDIRIGQGAEVQSESVAVGAQAQAKNAALAVGGAARSVDMGTALGYGADAVNESVAVGLKARAEHVGTCVGAYSQAPEAGAALGYGADATHEGVAVGVKAQGFKQGVAVGMGAEGYGGGVAVGHISRGSEEAVAVGYQAWAAPRNVAIGPGARAPEGKYRVAIGHYVTNTVDLSVRMQGDLYLDGGSALYVNEKLGGTRWKLKAFTIDHPLDPENKVLRHFCMESPEVWNVYAGNAQLSGGRAEVELPDYYSALNKVGSEVYCLTPIGEAQVWVEEEVENNRFVIGGRPDVKVSWTIKVLRNDEACREELKRRPVEQWKSELWPGQEDEENEQVNTFPE